MTNKKPLLRRVPKSNKVVRGKSLQPNAGNMAKYYGKIRQLVLKMTQTTLKELDKLFKAPHSVEYFTGMDVSVASQARILMNELEKRFDDLFGLKSKGISEDFTDDVSRSSASALKISLKDLAAGVTLKTDIITGELKEVLTATIAENVGLIKSIPEQYLNDVRGAVFRSISTGNGLADLVPFLKKHEGITLRRARLIAHDQTRKAFTNINSARMRKLGVDQFEWLHSAGGQTPRPYHKNVLNGNIYSINDPPVIDEKTGERGLPGQLINCRCTMIPVLKFDDED